MSIRTSSSTLVLLKIIQCRLADEDHRQGFRESAQAPRPLLSERLCTTYQEKLQHACGLHGAIIEPKAVEKDSRTLKDTDAVCLGCFL